MVSKGKSETSGVTARSERSGDLPLPKGTDAPVFEAKVTDAKVEPAKTVVAETRVDIPNASVSDAVMLLDLRNTNALMFRNSGTGRFNMVYRRGDGTIGWVEPQSD